MPSVQKLEQMAAKARKLAEAEYAASKETREALAKDLGETPMVSGDQEWVANQFTKKEALSQKLKDRMKAEKELLDAPFWKTILDGKITGQKLYRKLGDLIGKDFKLYEKAAEKTVPMLERKELTKGVDEVKGVPAVYDVKRHPVTGAVESTKLRPGTGSLGPTPVKGVEPTWEYGTYGNTYNVPNPLNAAEFGSRAGEITLGGRISGGLGSVGKTALVAPLANWALNNENNPTWSAHGVAYNVFGKDKNDKTKTLEEHLRANPIANTALKNAEEKYKKERSEALGFNAYTERDGKIYTGSYEKNPNLLDTHYGIENNRVAGTLFNHYIDENTGELNPETSKQWVPTVQNAWDAKTPEAAEMLGQAMERKYQSINREDKKPIKEKVFPLAGITPKVMKNMSPGAVGMVLIYDRDNKKYELQEVFEDGPDTNI